MAHLAPWADGQAIFAAALLEDWTDVHRRAASPDRAATLARICPSAAAVLRVLLFQNPTVRLIVEGLRSARGTASLAELAAQCDRLDHARAPVLFLSPDGLSDLQDDRGRIAWPLAGVSAFRPTVSYQLKSVLKHAGILASDVRLGGGRYFDPTTDRWALA